MGTVSGRPGRKPACGIRMGPVVIAAAVTEDDDATAADLDTAVAVDIDAGGSLDVATVDEARLKK